MTLLKKHGFLLGLFTMLLAIQVQAQVAKSVEGNAENLPVREYQLSIDKKMVNITGKEVMGMAINDAIPGTTLRFTEGEYAKIHVTNNMDVETSVFL